ncbi:MAG: transposase [Bacteroidia bacterium]
MQVIEKLTPVCFYHIYNRGINGENLFKEKKNYAHFLTRLEKYILPVAEIYAYCLLKNHFHLLVRIRENHQLDASKQFAHCFNSYTQGINKLYKRTGGLFQTPFKRKEVTTENYITWLIWYIHANPEKHGLTSDFREWEWSSYYKIISDEKSMIEKQLTLEMLGNKEEFIAFHLQNKQFYQELTLEE